MDQLVSKIKVIFRLRWPKILGAIIILGMLMISFVALYRDLLDANVVTDKGWVVILEKEYLKNIIISPLWILVGYLFHLSVEKENAEYKQKLNQLNGLMKGKESVTVIDVREILQDSYDQDVELKRMQREKRELEAQVAIVSDSELKT